MATYSTKFNGRRNAWGEYVVRLYCDGKIVKDGEYFTDNKQDAIDTAKAMESEANWKAEYSLAKEMDGVGAALFAMVAKPIPRNLHAFVSREITENAEWIELTMLQAICKMAVEQGIQ